MVATPHGSDKNATGGVALLIDDLLILLQLPTGQIKMQLGKTFVSVKSQNSVATPHGSDKNATLTSNKRKTKDS